MNTFTNRSSDDHAIEVLAAAWLTEREEGLSPEQCTEFERWCAADPRHDAAVKKLERVCAHFHQLPNLKHAIKRSSGASSPVPVLHLPFRRVLAGLAAVIALAIGYFFLRLPAAPSSRVFVTTTDGYQRLTLEDRSVVELNADTTVRVSYSADERRVTLEQGEAYFSVAKDKARPFIVTAGRITARAVGTAFDVRRSADAVAVLVTEGRVQVANAAGSESTVKEAILKAGERMVVPQSGFTAPPDIETMVPLAIQQNLAWQAPHFVFAETPLSEVVAKFNQRNRVQLVIGDTELSDHLVGGNFRADNVEVFVRLLEKSRDIRAERPDVDRIILRKVR